MYVGIIALDEGGWAKWQWTKSGVSSGGRNSEGVIVVSGDMWRAYTHFAQMKVGFSLAHCCTIFLGHLGIDIEIQISI